VHWKPETRRFHGVKLALSWFPFAWTDFSFRIDSDIMSSAATRTATEVAIQCDHAGPARPAWQSDGRPGRGSQSCISQPGRRRRFLQSRGLHIFRQFVDHDITFDVYRLSMSTRCDHDYNMRSPPGFGSVTGVDRTDPFFMYSHPLVRLRRKVPDGTNQVPVQVAPAVPGRRGHGHAIELGCPAYLGHEHSSHR